VSGGSHLFNSPTAPRCAAAMRSSNEGGTLIARASRWPVRGVILSRLVLRSHVHNCYRDCVEIEHWISEGP
jgi:hypothetical protein